MYLCISNTNPEQFGFFQFCLLLSLETNEGGGNFVFIIFHCVIRTTSTLFALFKNNWKVTERVADQMIERVDGQIVGQMVQRADEQVDEQ